jgi:hypothetical protein
MTETPEGWKNYPYEDPFRHRLSTLLSNKGKLDLPTLAQHWLRELADVGLQEVDRSSGSPPKEPASYYPRAEPLHSGAVPITLEGSREVLWLKLDGRRSEQGYKRAEILDTPVSTDKAILAALTALEGKEIESEGLDEALFEGVLDSSKEEWPELSEEESRQVQEDIIKTLDDETIRALSEDVQNFRSIYDDPRVRAQHTLEYVVAFLRHYRPEFDEMPRAEQLVLMKEGLGRVNNFLKGLRQLEAFLEYGIAGKDLRPKIEDAAGDIRAAELRAVEGLSNREVGELLGIAPSERDPDRHDNAKARTRADRGERLLIGNLGEEGWRELVKAKRAQRDQYLSLSEEERGVVQLAEQEGLTLEQARSLINEVRRQLES